MATTSMQFGQSTINVVLNEGQLPAKLSTDASGNTVLVGAGDNLPVAYQKKVHSIKGETILDFAASGFLPAGASFSGSGTYANQGRVAVLSTGTLTHNPTGWHDGTGCYEFVPNADSTGNTGEMRLYFDGALGAGLPTSPLNFNSPDGIALEFEICGMDTSKTNFSITMEFSNNATSVYATNKAIMGWWYNDATVASAKEQKGRKYYRYRFDSTTTDAKSSPWPGYGFTADSDGAGAGTGADWTKPVNFLRFMMNKLNGQTIKFKAMYLGGWSTPCIIMGTDNVSPDALSKLVVPLFMKNNVPLYADQYWSALDSNPSFLDRYRRMYKAGVEINGNDLVDRPLGVDVTDRDTMRMAITATRDRCLAEGWLEGSKVWVSNNNSTSYLMIEELAAAGYVANRNGTTEGRYVFPEGGVPDPFRMPGISIDGKFLTDIQPMIDRCEEYGATMWMYFHNVWAKAQIDADRTNNITGTAGAPIAVNAGETPAAYRARALGLGTAIGTATVAYLDARIGSRAYTAIFYEDLKEIVDYIGARQLAGGLVTRRPTDWCRDVGLL